MQASTESVAEMKRRFFANLFSEDSRYNGVLMTKRKYDSVIEDVKRIKASKKKESSRDYRIIQRYDVVAVQDCERLVEPSTTEARETAKVFVHAEELFEILYSTHLSIGHGGRDRMIKQLNTLYKNITQAQIRMFLDLCEPCQQRQKSAKRGVVVKPIISSPHFDSRCQVDLVDFQSRPDGKFRFLLVYQDHPTKFVVLKPLTSKRADEVAYNLLDIFLLFGAPSILHCGNGREFCDEILECGAQLWPEIKMVNGKPGRGGAEGAAANRDIENMLATWMADNQTDRWSEGVRFVQFVKNRAYHPAIKRSPYEAMFGRPAKLGLSSSVIPQSVLHSINTEEDLEKLQESVMSNLTRGDNPLSAEPTVGIQEFIDGNPKLPSTQLMEVTVMKNTRLPCTSKESPLHVEKVVPDLPSTSGESPSQSVKRTIQGTSTESNSIEYVDLNDTTIIKSEPLDSPEIDVITPIYDIWDAPNDSPSPPVTPIASIQPTPCKLVQNTTSTTKADLCPNNVRVPVSEPPFKKPKIEDRFDVYGKNVAYKLREMDKVQRILAEKIINDALFEGEMGALTRHHKLVDESPSGSSPEVHYTGYTPYTAVQCVSPNSSRSESPGSASIHPHSNVSTADESHSRLVLP